MASSEHARIWFEADVWRLRDLGSSNGTNRNGEALVPGVAIDLSAGHVLQFGDEAETWVLDAVDPPVPMARRGALLQLGEADLLLLPNDQEPVASVYRTENQWTLDHDGRLLHVADGEVVVVAGEAFTLLLPDEQVQTRKRSHSKGSPLCKTQFGFGVSLDEEFVTLTLTTGGTRCELRPRAHLYLLLLLARQRIADQLHPESEQGWVHIEALVGMLRSDPLAINLWIHRARKQLASTDVLDPASVVERRMGTGQVRIGTALLEILPL